MGARNIAVPTCQGARRTGPYSAFRGGHCGTIYTAGSSVLDAAKTLDDGIPRQHDSDRRVSGKADRTHLQAHSLPCDCQDPLHPMRLRVIDPTDVTNGKHRRGHLGHRHGLTVRRRTDTRARSRPIRNTKQRSPASGQAAGSIAHDVHAITAQENAVEPTQGGARLRNTQRYRRDSARVGSGWSQSHIDDSAAEASCGRAAAAGSGSDKARPEILWGSLSSARHVGASFRRRDGIR